MIIVRVHFFLLFFSLQDMDIFLHMAFRVKSFLSNQLQILSLKLDRLISNLFTLIGLKLNFFPEILHVIGHPVYHEEIISSGNSKIRRAPTINSRVAFNARTIREE